MKTFCRLEEQLALWDGVLQLDGFEVVHQAEDVEEKTLRFTVIPKMGAAVCAHCGGPPETRVPEAHVLLG